MLDKMSKLKTFTANSPTWDGILVIKPRWVLYLIGFFISYEIGVEGVFGIIFTPMLVLSLLIPLIILLEILVANRVRFIPMFGWWLTFVGLGAITYAQSPGVVGSIQGIWFIFRLALAGSLIYPAYCWFLNKRQYIQTFLTIAAVSAALSGLIALIQTISNGNLLSGVMTNDRFLGFLWMFPPDTLGEDPAVLQYSSFINNIFRGHGTFYRANAFGAFMSIIIGLTWGLFRQARGRRQVFFGVLLGAQLVGILVTLSRTAWAAVLAAIAAAVFVETFFWGTKRLSRRQVQLLIISVFFGIMVLGIALQSNAASERLVSLLNPGQVPEFQWRIYIWKQAFQSIAAHPWFGTGTFTVVSNDINVGKGDFGAHNLFIGIAFERGLPALCIFLFLLGRFFTSTWKWLRSEYLPLSEKAFLTGLFSAGIAFIVAGMGSQVFDNENIVILFWILLAIAFTFADKDHKEI